MILVGQYDSPYVRRVAISLHLLGIPFERNTLSVFADAEAMRRINPLGRIPSLVLDDDETLIDSGAILDYLDDAVGPERALVPARGPTRRRALRLIALATGAMDKVGATVYERFLRPPERQHEPWLERCRTQLATALAALEAETADGGDGYLGARTMQPDITVACLVFHVQLRTPESFAAARYPRLARLADRLEATPEFAATRPAADEKMPDRPL